MSSSQNSLIIVPARGGSKRLPGKNLMHLGGKSLIEHTAAFLAGEGMLACAILSTDDDAIAAEGARVGLTVPFLRPQTLATDTATTLDVVLHALEMHTKSGTPDPAVVVVLQVTSPLRRPRLLVDALGLLQRGRHANSVVAMSRLHVPASYVFTAGEDLIATPVSALPTPALMPSGSLYVTRTAALRQQKTLYAHPIVALEVSPTEAIDIDTDADLRLAQALLPGAHGRHDTCGDLN